MQAAHRQTADQAEPTTAAQDLRPAALSNSGQGDQLARNPAAVVKLALQHGRRASPIMAGAGEWLRAFDAYGEAIGRYDTASLAAHRLKSPEPTTARFPEAVERHAHWSEQCAAIDSAFGVPGLHDTMTQAGRLADTIARQTIALVATTPAEAAVKLALAADIHGLELSDEGADVFAIARELAAMPTR